VGSRRDGPSPEAITLREHHSFVQLPPAVTSRGAIRSAVRFFGFGYMITPRRSVEPS